MPCTKTEAAPAARAAPLTSAGTPPVAATCQVALGRKRSGYLAQRHPARLQLLGQRHDVRPSLYIRPAPTTLARGSLLAIARSLELGDQRCLVPKQRPLQPRAR